MEFYQQRVMSDPMRRNISKQTTPAILTTQSVSYFDSWNCFIINDKAVNSLNLYRVAYIQPNHFNDKDCL